MIHDMHSRLVALALAAVLLCGLIAPTQAFADGDGVVVAARVSGNLPDEGVAIALWDGGSVETLATDQPEITSVWVTVNGSLIGYLVGAPGFVNSAFLNQYPLGNVATGTPVLAVVGSAPATTPPPATTGYSAVTWNAFNDTLLAPIVDVDTCPNCWPAYSGGSTIGVTTRWIEARALKVYLYSGTPEDIATFEAQLDAFTSRLDIPWSYAATPGEANLHLFLGFDRLNIPAAFPQWAQDNLAEQLQAPNWSAYTSTSYSYSVGPTGADPAERFAIADAAVFVPFDQADGTPIPRQLLDTNIRHELVHAVGWSNHWSVPGRLMSPVANSELSLSDLEWDMLTLLYDDDVLPGMYDAQILATVDIAN